MVGLAFVLAFGVDTATIVVAAAAESSTTRKKKKILAGVVAISCFLLAPLEHCDQNCDYRNSNESVPVDGPRDSVWQWKRQSRARRAPKWPKRQDTEGPSWKTASKVFASWKQLASL